MATRSVIAKLDNSLNFPVQAIYCHNDGYLEYNGRLLNTHYTNEDKVNKLLVEGDTSSLGREIGIKTDFNSSCFNKGDNFAYQCKFYHRDRGEKNKQATQLKDESALLEFAFEQCDAEVVYMFAYGAWYVYDNSNKIGDSSYQFIELEEALYTLA